MLIVGGGITGCGILLDAAQRGLPQFLSGRHIDLPFIHWKRARHVPRGGPFLGFGPDGRLRQQWQLQAGSGLVEGLPGGVWTLDALASDGRLWRTRPT